MKTETVNIDGTDFNDSLELLEFPESVMSKVEAALEAMQADPGGESHTITIVIANNFEPEDEESEDEDEESA